MQVHKLFRRQAQSHRPDTGSVGGQAQGADVRHGPVERAPADGPDGRRVAAGTGTRPVAMSGTHLRERLPRPRLRRTYGYRPPKSSSYDVYNILFLQIQKPRDFFLYEFSFFSLPNFTCTFSFFIVGIYIFQKTKNPTQKKKKKTNIIDNQKIIFYVVCTYYIGTSIILYT